MQHLERWHTHPQIGSGNLERGSRPRVTPKVGRQSEMIDIDHLELVAQWHLHIYIHTCHASVWFLNRSGPRSDDTLTSFRYDGMQPGLAAPASLPGGARSLLKRVQSRFCR